jgi:hypothetical protein
MKEYYGGIFTDRPFEFNAKCVFIAIAFMIAYWYLPSKNPYLLPIIFLIIYVGIAWYDYIYECKDKLYTGRGIVGIYDSAFKPQRRDDKNIYPRDKYLVQDQEKRYQEIVNLFHVIFVMPLLVWIGYNKNNNNPDIYPLLLWFGIIAGFYHIFRYFVPRKL